MDYSYNDLVKDINIGHDIEFEYNEKKYSICNGKDGYSIGESYQEFIIYKTTQELLDNAKINGKLLHELWDEVEIIEVY